MKHDLNRLSMGELDEVQEYIRKKKRRRRTINHVKEHTVQYLSIALGIATLPLAYVMQTIPMWALLTAGFSTLFVLDWIAAKVHRRRRAHWVGRDTGPLPPL